MTNNALLRIMQSFYSPLARPPRSGYPIGRSGFFFTLMIAAMVAVLASLIVGIVSMAKGGEFNKKYGNRLMRTRVTLQGLALLFFLLAVWSNQN